MNGGLTLTVTFCGHTQFLTVAGFQPDVVLKENGLKRDKSVETRVLHDEVHEKGPVLPRG